MIIVKQTHIAPIDDISFVFDLSAINLLSSYPEFSQLYQGNAYGKYTKIDLLSIAHAFETILLSNEPTAFKGKVKIYRKGELIAY